ncbi:MAG: hypothetical protein JST92_15420 [Deltaproteobacteria bacterium]|nr:hypothetical protein [Deltaproteobacteria bacterium]
MLGRFRTDLEVHADPAHPGTFRLRRRFGARAFSVVLVAVGFCAVALDLALERHAVAALQLPLSVALLWLHLRAELDGWIFEGHAAVRKSFDFRKLRFSEVRVDCALVERVVLAQEGNRACAWLELRTGERHALVAGPPQRVEPVAKAFERGFALAVAVPPSSSLH